jgi:hypothetical protein
MGEKVSLTSDGIYYFFCPGCESGHGFNQKWSFNGNLERPTFSPSILVRGVEPITDEEHGLIMSGGYVEPRPFVCHSFVTDGKIQFLSDCTHKLAGQTMDLPDVED